MAMDHDMDDHGGDADRNRPSDHPEVAGLNDLGDFEVAEGFPDPRGWTVTAADGTEVGKVHDLIVDTGTMRTRYLDVRLSRDVSGSSDDRDVLVPIGAARVDDQGDTVVVSSLGAERFATLPTYQHGSLSRDQESELRTHFTSGDAASAGAIGAGAVAGSDFYDHDHFDDRSFFSNRDRTAETQRAMNQDTVQDADAERLTVSEEQLDIGKRQVSAGEVGVRKNVETRHVEQEVPLMREEVTVERRPLSADASTGDIRITDDEIRVPVMREEAVVTKRLVPTEEIIIRKTAARDTETVGADLRRERVEVDNPTTTDRTRDDRTNP